ncbi:DMT family transporter [Brenneria populi subsp. brevivirga]|uniref:DMT family transporter n=1 Tax=Brenneria populi TaxID=1505588 RepID=UPI002E197E48|nr:DMT family transporter [Brenneria populi subsp. brevivirga]
MNMLFPLVTVLIWSVNIVVNKLSAAVIDPAAISFYRWLLALITLTPFLLPGLYRHWASIRRHWGKLLVLGLLGMVLYQSLAYYAAHSISALMMGIMVSLVPLLTVLLSIPILKLVPTLGMLTGAVLSFCGIVWLISGGNPGRIVSQGIGSGELMMFIAAIAYALYGVLAKRWSIPLPNLVSLYMQIAFGTLLLLPNFLLADQVQLTAQNLPLILFAGILASVVAPFLWLQSLVRLGANNTAIFINLMPVFTALIATTFLNEHLRTYHLVGGGMALLGVILAQRLRIPLFGSAPKAGMDNETAD